MKQGNTLGTLALLAGLTGIALPMPALAGGWMGIAIQPPRGVEVGEIIKESPGDKSGMMRGDVILQVNGSPVQSVSQFTHIVSSSKPGAELLLTVLRKGKQEEVKVILGDSSEHGSLSSEHPAMPPLFGMGDHGGMMPMDGGMPMGNMPPQGGMGNMPPQGGMGNMPPQGGMGNMPPQGGMGNMPPQGGMGNMPPQGGMGNMPQGGMGGMAPQHGGMMPHSGTPAWLGVSVVASTGGVEVQDVAPNSPAQAAGLKEGDLIAAVNGLAVTNPAALVQIVNSQAPESKVVLSINRKGQAQTLDATLGRRPGN